MYSTTDQYNVYQRINEVKLNFAKFKQQVLVSLNTLEEQLHKLISDLYPTNIFQNFHEQIICNPKVDVSDEKIIEIVTSWNNFCYLDNKENIYQAKFCPKLVTRINLYLLKWSQQISEMLQFDQSLIPLFNVDYTFHENHKFTSIKLNDNMQIEQQNSQQHYCFAVVSKPLDQFDKSIIRFNFPRFVGDIGIGVCDLDILRTKNFRPQLNQLGNGAFVLFQDSYTINTEREEFNWKTKGFKFNDQDSIEVCYNPSISEIVWKKINERNDQNLFQTKLMNANRMLHFCVVVKTQGATVQIVP